MFSVIAFGAQVDETILSGVSKARAFKAIGPLIVAGRHGYVETWTEADGFVRVLTF